MVNKIFDLAQKKKKLDKKQIWLRKIWIYEMMNNLSKKKKKKK
jgi:hypothetical protein